MELHSYKDGNSVRRQEIIDEFKTVYRMAERIMELEAERPVTEVPDIDDKTCHFAPEYHPIYGHVTHIRFLGEMNGYHLEVCAVCGVVQARPPVIYA